MADDEDEGTFGGAFEAGHWIWDDNTNELVFVSDLPQREEVVTVPLKAPTGTVEFRELDVIEQMRFRKRYQRKIKQGQKDVISIQDVKDLVLYTMPLSIMSPALINLLHVPTIERFLRALILYCQYFLEIQEEMAKRILELESKVRTADCKIIENIYRENLNDLRSLLGKEYCTLLIGGDDTKKFHHMGPLKKRRSLSDKDARLFETLLRISIQIVWIALERRSFNQLELEVNRIFKSDIFNIAEHNLKLGYPAKMSSIERNVLLGTCLPGITKLNVSSPLASEIFCSRPIDYRMMGLGVIKYKQLPPRLKYMLLAIAAPEEKLKDLNITVGILGLPRSWFDTVLTVLPTAFEDKDMFSGTKSNVHRKTSKSSTSSKSSTKSGSLGKSMGTIKKEQSKRLIYDKIELPGIESEELIFPAEFPEEFETVQACNDEQRKRWQLRLYKLLHPVKRAKRQRSKTAGTHV